MPPSIRSIAMSQFSQRSSDSRWQYKAPGCAATLAPSSDTSAWMAHLRSQHTAHFHALFSHLSKRSAAAADMDDPVLEDVAPAAASASVAASETASSCSSSKKQRTLREAVAIQQQRDPSPLQKLAVAFASSSIAHAVVETPSLRSFLTPSCATLCTAKLCRRR